MSRAAKAIAVSVSILFLALFVVFVVNQTAQVVDLAETAVPGAGRVVLWALVGLYAVLVLVPVVLFVRLPPPLRPPETDGGPELEAHLRALRKRLAGNPELEGRPLESREDVEAALERLKIRSDEVIREAATLVFLSTAVSQSGRLDTVAVLAAQNRMVWRLARLHFQRPTVRDMSSLYGNVAATALLAGELEDIEISEQLQPLLAPMVGGLTSAVPGLNAVSRLLMDSFVSGAANAFFTLCVGIITRQYCESLVRPERRRLKRMATAEAAKLVGRIVRETSGRIVKTAASGSAQGMARAANGIAGFARTTGSDLRERFRRSRDEEAEPPPPPADPGEG